jgi:hypothetical protein
MVRVIGIPTQYEGAHVNTTVRLPILVLLILLGWTGASHSQASVVAAVTQWGLLGDWSSNCNTPASKDFTHTVYVVRDGKVFAGYDFGKGPEGIGPNPITAAKIASQGSLVYRYKQGTEHVDHVTTKVGADKKRDMSVLFSDGTVSVKNGLYVIGDYKGKPTPVFTRCKKL